MFRRNSCLVWGSIGGGWGGTAGAYSGTQRPLAEGSTGR